MCILNNWLCFHLFKHSLHYKSKSNAYWYTWMFVSISVHTCIFYERNDEQGENVTIKSFNSFAMIYFAVWNIQFSYRKIQKKSYKIYTNWESKKKWIKKKQYLTSSYDNSKGTLKASKQAMRSINACVFIACIYVLYLYVLYCTRCKCVAAPRML